jgi:hypothetical protein
LDTIFSKREFDLTIDQTLGDFVPASVITKMKTWMDGRRAYVQSFIAPLLPPATNPPIARFREPCHRRRWWARPDSKRSGVTQYRYSLNGGAFGPTNLIAALIVLANLPHGSTNTVFVIGAGTNGIWQVISNATVSKRGW